MIEAVLLLLFLLILFLFHGDLGPLFSQIIWMIPRFQDSYSVWAVSFMLCVVVVVVIAIVYWIVWGGRIWPGGLAVCKTSREAPFPQ